jgi:hypothetical protein
MKERENDSGHHAKTVKRPPSQLFSGTEMQYGVCEERKKKKKGRYSKNKSNVCRPIF